MKQEAKDKIEAQCAIVVRTAVDLLFDVIAKEIKNSDTSYDDISEAVCNELDNRSVPDECEVRDYAREEAESVVEEYVDGNVPNDDAIADIARDVVKEEKEDQGETLDESAIMELIDESCFNDSLTCAKSYKKQWDAFIEETQSSAIRKFIAEEKIHDGADPDEESLLVHESEEAPAQC